VKAIPIEAEAAPQTWRCVATAGALARRQQTWNLIFRSMLTILQTLNQSYGIASKRATFYEA
jgi:hypothetical protein